MFMIFLLHLITMDHEEDIIVATDNGVFRSSDIGKSWIIAPEMRDDLTNVPLTTDKFRALNSILDSNIE